MADLTVSDLALRYGEAEVLKGVSVTVPAGKVVALLGPSGSGKTTLLRAVAGLETPYRGSIRIGDHVLYDAATRTEMPAEARGLGLVLRSYALWPHRTVFENVAYGLKLRRAGKAAVKARVEKALSQIGLAHLAELYPHQLSGGQQQRIALARALVYEPPVILLDEPLSNLDAKLREEARAWLRVLIVSLNLSALLVTHDQIEAMAIADRITLLNAGRIEQQGSPIELYTEPATLFSAQFMGNNNRLEGTLVENADNRAVIEVNGLRLQGICRTQASIGEKAIGVIRLEKLRLGGGPGPNRMLMAVKAQMYIGERWELLFSKEDLAVRTYASAPLKHELYHVEFPPSALWIFARPTEY
jgi:iron(III) transport system ATP-binding protein